MKKLLTVILVLAGFSGLVPLASGQGIVTYTPLSASQFADYQNSSVWTLLLDIQHNGSGSLSANMVTNAYTSGLGAAYAADIFLSADDGNLTVTNQITNGRFNTTGATAGTSLNTDDILSGIVIVMTDAYSSQDGGATLNDLYIGNNYQPNVDDTTGTQFSGILCTFSDPTAAFNAIFTLNQPAGSGEERIFVLGIANVPEPGSLTLVGMGLAFGAAIFRHRK